MGEIQVHITGREIGNQTNADVDRAGARDVRGADHPRPDAVGRVVAIEDDFKGGAASFGINAPEAHLEPVRLRRCRCRRRRSTTTCA